jgi:hypothetical protein
MAAAAEEALLPLGTVVASRLLSSGNAPVSEKFALAAVVHHLLLGSGFECTGTSDVDSGGLAGFAAPTQTVTEAEFLPSNWKGGTDGIMDFRYKHSESAGSTFLVKVCRMEHEDVSLQTPPAAAPT